MIVTPTSTHSKTLNRRKAAGFVWTLNKSLLAMLAATAIVLSYFLFQSAWLTAYNTATTMDIWLIISVTAFMVATGLVMTGRYFERKLELESNLRGQKIDIYDDFLHGLTLLFKRDHTHEELVAYVTLWQSKLILWGDGETIHALIRWHDSLFIPNGGDHALQMLDDFIRALRNELGHTSSKIEQGAFIHLMINHDIFLREHTQEKSAAISN